MNDEDGICGEYTLQQFLGPETACTSAEKQRMPALSLFLSLFFLNRWSSVFLTNHEEPQPIHNES